MRFGELETLTGDNSFSIRLVLKEGPLDLAWHHAGTTSEFLGEMLALRGTKTGLNYRETRHSIIYMVNELLENAIKFHCPGDIELRCGLEGDTFELAVMNRTEPTTAAKFQTVLAELTTRDPGELMIERIEANAADETSSASGLGILTLMNDYGVRMGWHFSDILEDGTMLLRTQASLTLN